MPKVQPWREVPRQDGRRFVVTGASSGIGLETARALAAAGAEVVLAVRNPDKGEAAAGEMSGDVEVAPARRRRPVVGARLRRRRRSGRRPRQQRRGPGLPFGLSPDGFETAPRHQPPRPLRPGQPAAAEAHRPGGRRGFGVPPLRAPRPRRPATGSGAATQPFAAYAPVQARQPAFLAELQRRLTAAGSTLRATGAHPGYDVDRASRPAPAAAPAAGLGRRQRAGRDAGVAGRAAHALRRHDGPARQHLPRPARARGDARLADAWSAAAPRRGDPDLAKALWAASEALTGRRSRSEATGGYSPTVTDSISTGVLGAPSAAPLASCALVGDALDDLDGRPRRRCRRRCRRRAAGCRRRR